ncbi:hypothetical protein ABIF62_004706 [Bradyrhizobium japonicum]
MCVIFEPRPSSAGELPACKAKSAGMATGIMHTRRRWAAGRVTGLSLPDGQNTREGVKPRLQQYSTLPKFGNDVCVVHPGSPRGAILCRHCREPGLRWTRQRWAREVRAGRIALREPKTSCRMSGAARLRLVCKFPAPSTGLEKLRRNGGPCVRQNRVVLSASYFFGLLKAAEVPENVDIFRRFPDRRKARLNRLGPNRP